MYKNYKKQRRKGQWKNRGTDSLNSLAEFDRDGVRSRKNKKKKKKKKKKGGTVKNRKSKKPLR